MNAAEFRIKRAIDRAFTALQWDNESRIKLFNNDLVSNEERRLALEVTKKIVVEGKDPQRTEIWISECPTFRRMYQEYREQEDM
jgi:hypothetical protein